MKICTLYSLLLFIMFLTNVIQAQEKDTLMVQIETIDGNEFIGEIVSQDYTQLILKTSRFGKIVIQKADIKKLTRIDPGMIKEGKLWFTNPQSTRYFWAPNGYGLKKGEGYYQNIYVFWNQFSYGLTDNLSMGIGIIPTFLFGGGPTPVFLVPKISIPVEKNKINLGAGALVGTVLGESNSGFGILYGLSTFGSPDNNVSVGLGYGYAGGDWSDSPLINLSGLFRLSSRAYFLTENYYVNIDGEGGAVLSLGGRWIIKKASLDFTFAIPVIEGMDTFVAAPLIGFTIPLGNSKGL